MRLPTLALATALGGLAAAAQLKDWQSRSIYQVMIDRFARTDGSTTAPCTDLSVHCNGTWTGLKNHLDYIQGMGFTAIQISPVVENIKEGTIVGESYHGYWSKDLYALNDRFGTKDDLTSLIAEIHKRAMYIMVDVVVNNMAQAFNNTYPPTLDYSKFNPFNSPADYHPYCNVTQWANSTDYQDCWLYPLGVALADLKTEDPTVVSSMQNWVSTLVTNYSIDGIRIDAAKHVNDAFLPQFVNASKVFALGEVLTGEVPDLCRYQKLNLLNGMPNYLDYYKLITVFNGQPMTDLSAVRTATQAGCPQPLALGTFIENHDMPRFGAINPDLALAKNAITYILMNDGIPLFYQGQEQHLTGGTTPANREALWTTGYNTSSELYVLTATLNKLRNNAIAKSPDYITTAATELQSDPNHLCLVKGPHGSQIVFCINNKSSKGDSYEMPLGGFDSGEDIVEVLGCTSAKTTNTGTFTGYFAKGEPKVWVLKSALPAGMCNATQDAGQAAKQNGVSKLSATSSIVAAVVLGFVVMML